MLTRTFDYWTIRTDDDDRHSSDKEFFDTFADAMAARMSYANWCCKKGDCTLVHYRLGPDSMKARVIDVMYLRANGGYRIVFYGGCPVQSESASAWGDISELQDLFE